MEAVCSSETMVYNTYRLITQRYYADQHLYQLLATILPWNLTLSYCSRCHFEISGLSLTRGSSPWRVTGNNPWKSKTTEVQAISVEVIFPQKFCMDFRNAVYGFGTLDCYIGRWPSGRLWSKRSYRTRYEEFQFVLFCQFNHIVYTCKHHH
jgi:hypothetical protein